MKQIFLVPFFILISCGPPPEDPQEFLYEFEGTTFKATKLRSFDSTAWFVPSGVKTYTFDGEGLEVDHSNYDETGYNPCYGKAIYSYSSYDYENFVKSLEEDSIIENEEESGVDSEYDVFDPYKDYVSDPGGTEEEERVEVKRFYFIGELNSEDLNVSCNLLYENTFYFQVNFYRDGDMEFFDHNRKILFFNRPI